MARTKLMTDELHKQTQGLTGWQVTDGDTWLRREYKFANFAEALAFVNKVGELAEAADHHPDIELGWGYVRLRLQTHDAGGICAGDIAMAKKINQLS